MITRSPRRVRSAFATSILILAVAACSSGGRSPATERTQVLADWEALRFGMFIHFGMSTFTGEEFGAVPAQAKEYAPTALDVDQWIRVARDGGMNYAILTTKHCYGHALWDSKSTNYDVEAGPVKTDVVRAFVDACRRYGVKPGFYYLLGWDKVNQWARTPADYEAFCRGQIEELLTGYGPITELWLDIPWDMGPDTQGVLARLYGHIKSLQPDCLVLLNQGFVDGSAVRALAPTYAHREYGLPEILLWPKDLINGEVIPPPSSGHEPKIAVRGKIHYLPMETCDTLAHHWFWEPGDALKSVRTLVRTYRSTVDRGANLLLDLAPDRTGRIPESMAKRLMDMKAALADPSLVRPSLTLGATATASNVHKQDKEYEPGRAIDDDSNTRWATDETVSECWLEVDLGTSRHFDGAFLSEGWDRVRSFALESRRDTGEPWRTIFRGAAIGTAGLTASFPATEGRYVRLHILEAAGGPTIWDFELHGPGTPPLRYCAQAGPDIAGYLDRYGQAPVDYVLSRAASHRVTILGEAPLWPGSCRASKGPPSIWPSRRSRPPNRPGSTRSSPRHPGLRFVDYTDGYVWPGPLESFRPAMIIPLAEFAPDAAAMAQIAKSNPFTDDTDVSPEKLAEIWSCQAEENRDLLAKRGWKHLAAWRTLCR